MCLWCWWSWQPKRPAEAYLDPGAGSILLQVLLGGFAAAGVFAKLFWHSLSAPFRKRAPTERGSVAVLIGMSVAEVGQFEPASFRDPAARVLRHEGQILRYLTSAALRNFEALSATRFYREFTGSGRLVATELATSSQTLPLSDPWVAVLRHQTIPVVSYPYEWCFSMLQDAALLQLDLQVAALDEGMTLKDATPFQHSVDRYATGIHRHRILQSGRAG